MSTSVYQNPLVERYGSEEMLYIFSSDYKFTTWRKLWIALAEAQKSLGLNITDEQIQALKDQATNIDYDKAKEYERKFRHDVMAHVHAYGDVAPIAKPIIHLGATSAFLGDNTDLIQIKEALALVEKKIVNILAKLSEFANQYKDLPTLGFTHFQPAQLTTVGKRATLWMQSLMLDLEEVSLRKDTMRFRGVKGTTGTAASFKELFDGDYDKVKTLDQILTQKFGFSASYAVTGQTYDRKFDAQILNLLSNIAQSAHKFSNDIRLLQHLKEIEEPFEKDQIGSSAMAYKRNPMRSERMSALAKFVISMASSPAMVAATQWFERTLDDSANKRLSIPQSFLAIDSILDIWYDVASGLVVYPAMIARHIEEELPFMATEYIIMQGVKNGGDRQVLHEQIRTHSMAAARQVKEEGKTNDLIQRISEDSTIQIDKTKLGEMMNPLNFIGFAIQQTDDFLSEEIAPLLEKYQEHLGLKVAIKY
ncbi:MAG: adenylosuccinate lyase [Chitinophagales bacterium]|nr:adenylosuccinate lyase [Chitinophagales bacterium]